MTIIDVVELNSLTEYSPFYPWVYSSTPGGFKLASFWTDTFGVSDESKDISINIGSFVRGFLEDYNQIQSLNDCINQEQSFYWDNPTQILYVHFEHNQGPLTDSYEYGSFLGYSDNDIVYIDDQEYLPLVSSIPSLAQQQDLIDYNKLSFMTGAITLNNIDGILDFFITNNLYGNDVFLYYLDEADISDPNTASRSDLVPLASFFIEDYDISLKQVVLKIQDKRKAEDITIPRDTFEIADYPDIGDESGNVIPLMYGNVREAKGIPTNSETISGESSYRVALLLTGLGIVQVSVDDVWTTVTPTSISLSTGEFSLSESDGRKSSGAVLDCRVLEPTGIVISKTSDIIKDLNERFLGILFIDSNYDITEWQAEELSLSSGGWVFDKEIKLFDGIRLVQNGSLVGFRYEILPNGKRTIRIDDPTRKRAGRIEPVDIQNIDDLPVETDSDLVFAEIRVKYDKSFNSGRFITESNNDFSREVLENYERQNRISPETMLNNESDASTRALSDATKFKDIPSILTAILMGKEFLPIRIFDIYDTEVTPGFADADTGVIVGREYYGIRKAKVLSINPDIKKAVNSVTLQLLEQIVPEELLSSPGDYGFADYGGSDYGG